MDKYDDSIQEILQAEDDFVFRRLIDELWAMPSPLTAGCLFQFATRSGGPDKPRPDSGPYGCLTMIRSGERHIAETESLTRRIRADERIPDSVEGITRSNLHVFAEWQRILDKELGR